MVEKLAKHERLALYNLTEREIDQLEEELVKQFPKEQFAETYIEMSHQRTSIYAGQFTRMISHLNKIGILLNLGQEIYLCHY